MIFPRVLRSGRLFAQKFSTGSRAIMANISSNLHEDITTTVGNTPVVNVSRMLGDAAKKKNVQLFVKCEFFNPCSSVKDRLAVAIINDAERKGLLKPNDTVIEATSGNTGIALAMVCAARGYPFIAVMAESFSVERRKAMRALGAKVILTPALASGLGMVEKARELSEKHGWFWTRQFENEANPRYHASTTGAEILRDFANHPLNYWVTGFGTGGTFLGAGSVLKAARPEISIILAEPDIAPLVTSAITDGIPQEYNEDRGPAKPHPAFLPHPIQGWTPNFIPRWCDDGLKNNLVSEVMTVSGAEAIETALRLARTTGVFTGISGGATTAVAIRKAEEAMKDAVLLAMLPDTMERYMSTPLFENVNAEMNDEEWRIAESTPIHIPQRP